MPAQNELVKRLSPLLNIQGLPQEARTAIETTINEAKNPLTFDVWIYRAVVAILGTAVLLTVIGGILLTYLGGGNEKMQLSQGIVAIGSAAVGALAGLLAPSPQQK